MREWQPIETAPNDDRIVMVYFGPEQSLDGYVAVGHFFQYDVMPKRLPTGWPSIIQPTHWMPLPAPPQVAST